MSGATDMAGSEFRAGYRLGYATGYDIGHAHGVAEEGAAWTSIMTGVTELWRQPRHEDTLRARELTHDPCPMWCRKCSRCIHALDWIRRGRRPFEGVEAERRRAEAIA